MGYAGNQVSSLKINYVEHPDRKTELLVPWLFEPQTAAAVMMPTCPGNQTIDLDPGECGAVVDYNFGLPDIPVVDTTFSQNNSNAINSTIYCLSGPTTYKRTFFNGKYTDISINQISLGVFSSINNPTVVIRFTNTAGTIVYGSHQYIIPNLSSALYTFAPGGLIKLPARSNFVMEVIASQPGVSTFMIGRTTDGSPTEAGISGCTVPNVSGPNNANSVYFTCSATPDDYRIVQTAPLNGLESGDEFPIGTTNMNFNIFEPLGPSSTPSCSFTVTVNGFDEATGAIACNDEVRVSLGDKCEAIVTPDMLLEGDDYGCYDDYEVKIYRPNGTLLGNKVTRANLGQKLKTQVFGPNGNSCWGEIIVEDKLPPILVCDTVYANCRTNLTPGSTLTGVVPVAATINDGTLFNVVNIFDIPVGDMDGSTITDLDVYLNISHESISDLSAELISPDGITVPLFLQQPLCTGENLSVSFDSDASDNISCDISQTPAIGGRFKPASSLDIFDGGDMGGTWRVRIYDNVAGVNGEVNDIHLIFSQIGGTIPFPTDEKITVSNIDDFTYNVTGMDACSNTILSYNDHVVYKGCDSIFSKIIRRCWQATDAAGNISNCCQMIYVYRNSLSTIEFPVDFDGLPGNQDALSCMIFGDSIPPVEHTGLPEGDFCDNVQLFEPTDVKIPICAKSYKLLRTHKIIDWCTGEIIVHNQVIKVLDDQGPELECPRDTIISTDNYTCSATYIVPRPIIKQECSGAASFKIEHKFAEDPTSEFGVVGVNQITRTIRGLPLGYNTIRWIVTDSCGNASSCEFEVLVEDDDRPNAVCDIYTVASITGVDGGKAIVDAFTFDDGSNDNCGILKFEARKMTDKCNFGIVNFTPTVEFCCEEVNTSVMVEMRVTDVNGNSNTCMVEVRVQDKLPPYITKCPADITLECQSDYENLTVTGRPEYVDNCTVDSVWYKDVDSISQCGTGRVVRTWTVRDKQNLRHSCVQVITLIDKTPFWVNRFNHEDPTDDVVWPRNYTTNKCFSKLHPDSIPKPFDRPTWKDDNCNLVAAHYKDQIFKFADGACEKILRTWTVLDWCTYDERVIDQNGYVKGKYEYIQIIKLQNDIPPQFEFACIDRRFPSYGECKDNIKFSMSAIDDCPEGNDSLSWRYELFTKNGTVPIAVVVNTRFFERVLSNGEYRIKWTVTDKCGNPAICEHKIFVEESKKPTPYCHTALTTAVMNSNGRVEIWAKDFDQGGFDNCTHKDSIWFTFFDALPVDTMLYREHYFKDNGKVATKAEYDAGNAQIWKPLTKSSGLMFDCNDIPNGKSQQLSLNVTLTDEAKNQDYCTINLILQDNANVCPDVNNIIAGISGRITLNNNGKSATDVIVESNAPEANRTIRSDANGNYNMSNLPANYNYTVSVEDNKDMMNGVSTLDLVYIQRHILGLEEFDDARKTIAADIDNSQKITASDLVALRKAILGITDNFPNGQKSWRFVTSDMNTSANVNPFPFKEKYVYNNLSELKSNQNFFAIKIGDINQNAKVNVNDRQAEPRSNSTLALETEVIKVSGSDEILIPVYAASFDDVLGYQFTLNFDQNQFEFIEMLPGSIEIKDQNFGFNQIHKGKIPVSWNIAEPIVINMSKPLFSLKFKSKVKNENLAPVSLSSDITAAEAYDVHMSKMHVKLTNRTKDVLADAYELKQNIPNPFTESTQISFILPESAVAKLTITDVAGKVVKVVERHFAKGENHIQVSRDELGLAGVLIYKLESGNVTDTKKMILLE